VSRQYLIHDRDSQFYPTFQQTIDVAGVKRVSLPARSPSLNVCAGRWVRSVKDEALSRLILFGEGSFLQAIQGCMDHNYHGRNHQGKGKVRIFLLASQRSTGEEPIWRRERLGGLLKYYKREAM
jgi:putative transposase